MIDESREVVYATPSRPNGRFRPKPGIHLPRLIAAKQSLAVQSWPSDPGRACRRMNSSGDIIKCVAPSLPSPASIPSGARSGLFSLVAVALLGRSHFGQLLPPMPMRAS
jgi:hypothetical protein